MRKPPRHSSRNRHFSRPQRNAAVSERSPSPSATVSAPVAIGKNTVREILLHRASRVARLYLAPSKGDVKREQIVAAAMQSRIAVEERSFDDLTALAGADSHQGVIALLRPRENLSLEDLFVSAESEERSVIVMLDSIFDPHNVGAIVRAAECFGAHGVILSKNRGAPLTAAVSKAGVGATELVPLCVVSNLGQAVLAAKEHGYFVIAADAAEGAVGLGDVSTPARTLIILGSEGEGVQPLLKRYSDALVKIPMSGVIDSLNVSQAAAVFLYAVTSRGDRRLE